jgi:hypothetical protein
MGLSDAELDAVRVIERADGADHDLVTFFAGANRARPGPALMLLTRWFGHPRPDVGNAWGDQGS